MMSESIILKPTLGKTTLYWDKEGELNDQTKVKNFIL